MILYPAIDLKDGQCVRLWQGDFNQTTYYHSDPMAMAQSFLKAGASWLHVVDLEGAKQGRPIHTDIILKLAKHLKIQTGGGIRKTEDIEKLLNQGISRIVIGSLALTEPEKIKFWLERFGPEKIVIAADIRIYNEVPLITTQGWQTLNTKSVWDFLDSYKTTSLKHILCTDIACDGTLKGPNFAFYTQLQARYPILEIQASGGIACLDDIQKLNAMKLSGAIIGKALYENKFALTDALRICEKAEEENVS